jgi:putative transposase
VRRVADIFGICRNKIGKSELFEDKSAEEIIKDFALKFPNYGYRMIAAKLRLEGVNFNHKKVYRIYKKLGLNFKANSKSRKLPTRKRILEIANNSNQIWSVDFMSGKINSRRFRTLNIIDEHARECLDIKILRSIPSNLVINALSQIISEQKRKPIAIRLDNGSEFTSCEFTNWAKKTI